MNSPNGPKSFKHLTKGDYAKLMFYSLIGVLVVAGLDELLEHFFKNVKLLEFLGPKILTALAISIFLLVRIILQNQDSLLGQAETVLQTVDKEIPELVKTQIDKSLREEGKELLRETIIDSVLKSAIDGARGGGKLHEDGLLFLERLYVQDPRLTPGLRIIAKKHVEEFEDKLNNLTQDGKPFILDGHHEVNIAEAFANEAKNSVFIYDPVFFSPWSSTYDDYIKSSKAWRASDRKYVIQCDDQSVYDNPRNSDYLKQIVPLLRNHEFEVFLVKPSDVSTSKPNANRKRHFEVYDSITVLKVEEPVVKAGEQPHYTNDGDLSITLRVLETDADLKDFVSILSRHLAKKNITHVC